MPKSRNPPRYIMGECFIDNLLKYGGEETDLADRLQKWLDNAVNTCTCPAVISPLHTPETGKPHLHFIIDVTNAEYRELQWFEGLFKSADLPRPELVRNIFNAEAYLTHDTLQAMREDKQRFNDEERATMRFLRGYTMHELTDRGSREEVSEVVFYVFNGVRQYIKDGGSCSNVFVLTELVCDPAFFEGLEVSLPASLVFKKAAHEVKSNFRFYLEYANGFKVQRDAQEAKVIEEKAKEARDELHKENAEFCSYLIGILGCMSDGVVQQIFYEIYSDDKEFRYKVREIGFSDLNYRLYLENYIAYCGQENSCSPHFVMLEKCLQKWWDKLGNNLHI